MRSMYVPSPTALDARARRILRLPALHHRARTPAFLNVEFLDKIGRPTGGRAHARRARHLRSSANKTSLPNRTWSNSALTTCACLRDREVARLAVQAPSP